jgi:hypothetical protein
MRLLTATRLRRVLAVRDLPRPAAPRATLPEPVAPIVLPDETALAI